MELQKVSDCIEIVAGDLSLASVLKRVLSIIGNRVLTGAVINSEGPPAMPVMDTKLSD